MPLHLLPFRSDLAEFCAKTVVSDLATKLPDLSSAVILVPEATARIDAQFIALHESFLDSAKQRGYDALIVPTIATPRQLFAKRYSATQVTIKNTCARLSLATALHQYKDLFPHANRWQLSDEIIALFEQISESDYASKQSASSLEKNAQMLASTWPDDTRILLSLWQIWKNLYDEKNYPAFAWYRMLLTDTYTTAEEHVYLCGINHLSPCFEQWVRNLYQKGRLTWIAKAGAAIIPPSYHPLRTALTQVTTHPPAFPDSDTDYGCFLDQVFAYSESTAQETMPFADRARQFSQRLSASPLSGRVRLFFPATTEEHAWGIYITVRRWLQAKRRRIALLSADRRLSRRIRAIFEKNHIPLIDYSGWELSTTSSAAAFKHLLNDADDELNFKTVLALLRSPYCDFGVEYDTVIEAADQIEQLLSRYQIPYGSVSRGLPRLTKAAASFHRDAMALIEEIVSALNLLEELKDKKEHLYTDYFECLFDAMKQLGMYQKLSADKAGARLISELQHLYEAVNIEKDQVYFSVWRGLILHRLEKSNFTPDVPDRGVFLMNPSQAELMQFDALVIAALDHRHFPRQPQNSLINDKIGRELGLETYEQSVGAQFLLLRTLLESAEYLLLSCQHYLKDRKLSPSAWLSALHHFHTIAYGDLRDSELQAVARQCSALALNTEHGIKPQIQSIAKPSPPQTLWPQPLSVGAYQDLIDCPYLFYARQLLKIRKRRTVPDYWDALSYGKFLHKCLEKLYKHLDASYEQPLWQEERRAAILDAAQQILDAQFRASASDNYVNYLWRSDALAALDHCIDWMIQQQQKQAILTAQTEAKLEKQLAPQLSLTGVIDLILHTADGCVLIDYKTGGLASKKDIRRGEHVQLLSYALLASEAKAMVYLALGAKNRGEQRTVSGTDVADYRDHNLHRLLAVKTDYDKGQALSAWGNTKRVCQYCDYAGLCRRPAWDEYHDWNTES